MLAYDSVLSCHGIFWSWDGEEALISRVIEACRLEFHYLLAY